MNDETLEALPVVDATTVTLVPGATVAVDPAATEVLGYVQTGEGEVGTEVIPV